MIAISLPRARRFAFSVLLAALALPVLARDERHSYPIQDVLSGQSEYGRLDRSIGLYFANQAHPPVEKNLGEFRTNKKTNGFVKSDKEACERAFLSALIELQQRTRKEGGDAVVGITSNYRNQEWRSESEYRCGSGALMSGVALKGTVVKLAK